MNSKNIMLLAILVAAVAITAVALVVANSSESEKQTTNGSIVGNVIAEENLPDSSSRLWVYGNANEDDHLDDFDVAYLQEVLNGKKTPTRLSDANADGEINNKDIDYLKKLISADSSTEIDVYYIDNYIQVQKVSWPVNSIATSYCSGLYIAETTGLTNKIKMVDETIHTYWSILNSRAAKVPCYGDLEEPDWEAILREKIDVFVRNGFFCKFEF